MNKEDLRKQHLRTQGKYSDDLIKNRDKKHKISPSAKEISENKAPKRYSNESRKKSSFLSDEASPVKYEEKSGYSFTELEEPKRPTIISARGQHILSETENGRSVIYYEPGFFGKDEAWDMFEKIHHTTNWNDKNIVIRGEEYPQPRLVAWYGPYPYSYSGTTLEPAEMPDLILSIKEKIEKLLRQYGINTEFNSVLLNLYRNEKDSVAWHSDDELTMGIHPTIASISLGEVRKFELRPKELASEKSNYTLYMNHGSLIIMDGCMQEDWQHRVPKEYHEKDARINLTFRTVFPVDKSPEPVKEITKHYSDVFNSTKSANSKKTLELDDVNFPALNNNVKPSTSDISGTSEVWSSDTSFDDKRKVQNWVHDNDITNNRKDEENVFGEEENSINATGLMFPDELTEIKNSERDLRFHIEEQRKKRLDKDFPNKQKIDDQPINLSDERLRNEPIDNRDFHCRYDENKRNGRFSRGQNDDRNHSTRCDEKKPFRNSINDEKKHSRKFDEREHPRWSDKRDHPRSSDERNHQRRSDERNYPRRSDEKEHPRRSDERELSGEFEETRPLKNSANTVKTQLNGENRLRQNENNEPYERQWGNGRNDRFKRVPASNKRRENFLRVQNEDERPGINSRMQSDNRYDRFAQRQDFNRRNERSFVKEVPPRFGNIVGFPSKRRDSDRNPPEDGFDNDKHASELVKKEYPASPVSDVDKELSKNTLNVEAKEFVPISLKPENPYDRIPLKELIPYEIHLMSNDILQNYSCSLKWKILEYLSSANADEEVKDNLEFLCQLTDGSQNVKNQRLISKRMVQLVFKIFDAID